MWRINKDIDTQAYLIVFNIWRKQMVAERGSLELKAVNDTSEVKGYNSELFCGNSDSLAYVKCLDCSCCCR